MTYCFSDSMHWLCGQLWVGLVWLGTRGPLSLASGLPSVQPGCSRTLALAGREQGWRLQSLGKPKLNMCTRSCSLKSFGQSKSQRWPGFKRRKQFHLWKGEARRNLRPLATTTLGPFYLVAAPGLAVASLCLSSFHTSFTPLLLFLHH